MNQTNIDFDEQCEKAADALAQADVLLLVTGAGWSADSGLAVYADIGQVPAYQQRGLEYADVCQPKWIESDPQIFYGFWGQCFNDYRATKPHEGYDIVARWRDDLNNKVGSNGNKTADVIRERVREKVETQRTFDSEEAQRLTPYDVPSDAGAFFSFTSNADAHFYDTFQAHEIHDCHGNIELWQCSNRDCDSGIWRAPIQHKFTVDKQTMLAPPTSSTAVDKSGKVNDEQERVNSSNGDDVSGVTVPCIGHTAGRGKRSNLLCNLPPATDEMGWCLEENSNWPKCGHCQSLARPAIFMFGDFGWKYDVSQSVRWDLWREAIVELGSEMNIQVVIVEVGCGERVANCRNVSEQLTTDVCDGGGKATLVRINPDDAFTSDKTVAEHLVPILSKGLPAIKRINEVLSSTE